MSTFQTENLISDKSTESTNGVNLSSVAEGFKHNVIVNLSRLDNAWVKWQAVSTDETLCAGNSIVHLERTYNDHLAQLPDQLWKTLVKSVCFT